MDFIGNGIVWPLLAWGVAGALILAGAVAVDARERGQSASLWFVLALLFPGFGALAYLVLRPAVETPALPAGSVLDRPPSAPLSATPARGSVPAAREAPRAEPPPARDVARPETSPVREASRSEPLPSRVDPRPEPSPARA